MSRTARNIRAEVYYHVLNRSAGRIALFKKDADFAAFERIMIEAAERFPLRIVDWCLMRNHWHFVVCPKKPHDLTDYFRWLTHTHAMRWRVARDTVGWGHLYQGRFKAFPVEEGGPLLRVRRYAQRNAMTAGVVKRSELWRWGSLWVREQGPPELRALLAADAPRLPTDWLDRVNAVMTRKELARLRLSVSRNCPYGSENWVAKTVSEMGLEHTVRREGRPTKREEAEAWPL